MALLDFFRSKKTETESEPEKVDAGMKIKVVATFLMVGFAVYIAYWVQDATDIKTDVLSSPTQTVASQESIPKTAKTEQPQEVSIIDFRFEPDTVTVKKGTTVIWTNKDAVPHTVTGDNFSSETLTPGQSFSYTFQADGSYKYHCSFHPQMKGTVIAGTGVTPKAATEQAKKPVQDAPKGTDSTAGAGFKPTTTTVLEDFSKENVDLKPSAPPIREGFGALLPDNSLNNSLLLNDGANTSFASSASAPLPKDGVDQKKEKLPESGPEEFFYVAIFLAVLYWQGKKRFWRSHI